MSKDDRRPAWAIYSDMIPAIIFRHDPMGTTPTETIIQKFNEAIGRAKEQHPEWADELTAYETEYPIKEMMEMPTA